MASSLKTVSDALISRLASNVASLDGQSVSTFDGSTEELAAEGRRLPFAGVSIDSTGYSELSADNSLVREDIDLDLLLVAEDFRGAGYSLENTYGLLDEVRDCLLGSDLGLEGLAPLEIASCSKQQKDSERGLTVFQMRLRTWQVRQRA